MKKNHSTHFTLSSCRRSSSQLSHAFPWIKRAAVASYGAVVNLWRGGGGAGGLTAGRAVSDQYYVEEADVLLMFCLLATQPVRMQDNKQILPVLPRCMCGLENVCRNDFVPSDPLSAQLHRHWDKKKNARDNWCHLTSQKCCQSVLCLQLGSLLTYFSPDPAWLCARCYMFFFLFFWVGGLATPCQPSNPDRIYKPTGHFIKNIEFIVDINC